MASHICVLGLLVALAGCSDAPANGPTLAVGGRHICILETTGELRCVGWPALPVPIDWVGEEGSPDVVPPVDVGDRVLHVDAAQEHMCAVTASGEIHCWGQGPGLGVDRSKPYHHAVTTVAAPFRRVRTGWRRTCGVTDDRQLWCWGEGPHGELGHDTERIIGDDEAPADVGPVPLPWPVTDVALGSIATCALLEDGRVGCWGDSVGTASEAQAVDVGGVVVQLEVGQHNFCGLLADGGVRCWGGSTVGHDDGIHVCWPGCNVEGCCKDGDLDPAARGDLPLSGEAVALSVGTSHTCVVLADGAVRCWGSNKVGELGLGHTNRVALPTEVDVGGPAEVVVPSNSLAWSARTCAQLRDGTVRCWGLTDHWDDAIDQDCQIEVSNPNYGVHGEDPIIKEFSCTAGPTCCIGDDEPAAAALPVPL